ncbi:hypothetical protein RCL1_002088 [Eukaryota sp. TZLM3-RCL]
MAPRLRRSGSQSPSTLNFPPLFHSFVFFIDSTNLLPLQVSKFQENIRLLGGTVSSTLDLPSVTHILTTDASHFLETNNLTSPPDSISIVSPKFIADCMRFKTLKPASSYFPSDLKSEFFQSLTSKPLIQHKHLHTKTLELEPPLKQKRMVEISDENLNPEITQELEKRAEIESVQHVPGSQYRASANKKAAAVLKKFPIKLTIDNFEDYYEELVSSRGIGDKTVDKIFEILLTGTLQRNVFLDERTKVILELEKVSGIGSNLANELYDLGARTTNDLLQSHLYERLTNHVKIGLKYLQDISHRIPRSVIEQIADVFAGVFESLNFHCKMDIVGSYRRGYPDSGDVDLLVTVNDDVAEDQIEEISELVLGSLTTSGLIPEDGILSQASSRVLGIIKLNNDDFHRRFDLFFAHESEYAFALLGKTGNDHFNRSLRYLAMRRGFSLSDHGLTRREDKNLRLAVEKATKSSDVQRSFVFIAKSEQDIFDFFKLPFIPPDLRNGGVFEVLQRMNKMSEDKS